MTAGQFAAAMGVAALLGNAGSAGAQQPGPPAAQRQATLAFAIRPQPLASALAEFSRVTALQASAPAVLLDGRRSPGVSGALAPEDALRRLLAGTGLAGRIERGQVMLAEAPPEAAAGGPAQLALPTMTIAGALPQGWAPVPGYVAEVSATGTKTDTPLIETPQSVSVVTRDQMDAQRAATVRDALRYTPGVVASQGFNRSDEALVLRGFTGASQSGSIFRDGLRYGGNNYGVGLIEPYGLEKVEVLRGPASVLFGQAEPGGVVNLVSKRPTAVPLHEIELSGGNYNNKQIGGDFGGPLDSEGKWSYRLTGLLRDSDTMVDHINDDRRYFAPALTWRPTADTSVTLLAAYQNSETRYNYGYPTIGTVLPNRNGQIPSNLFIGEPGLDSYKTENWSVGYQAEHRFNSMWTARQNFRYFDTSSRLVDFQYLGLAADQRTISRLLENRRTSGRDIDLDNQLQMKLETGPVAQTVLFGVDYLSLSVTDVRGLTRTATPLDLFNPRYGTPNVLTPIGTSVNGVSDNTQLGAYLQDQIKLYDKLVLVAGGRQDWARSETRNRLARTTTSVSDNAFTGRLGLVYLFDNGLAPYASYAESFMLASGTKFDGTVFDPTSGRQYEVGLRYQPPGSQSLITLAAYELTKQNVTTPDLAHTGFSVQTGEVRARGIEAEGRAALTDNLSLIGAYAFTDAKITRSNGPDLGRTPASVPLHQASLWGDYAVQDGWLRGFGIGGGVRYIGISKDTANSAKVPDYTLVDAMVRYDINEHYRLSLNAINLFDKEYIAACTYACFYGDRLTVTAALRYRW